MAVPETKDTSVTSDVLHFEDHSRLTPEEIAKAVARHRREHPQESSKKKASKSAKPPTRH